MIEDFDIRNNNQDLSYLYYSTYMDTLREITDSFSRTINAH